VLWPIFAKIAQILLPWQQWLARENFIGTIKSAVPKNPLFGANSVAVAFVQSELWPIWVENGRNFKIQYLKEYLTILPEYLTIFTRLLSTLVLDSSRPIALL